MQKADLVFVDGRIALPGGTLTEGWMSVADGKISDVGEGAAPPATETVDCKGSLVLPGAIDIHVHFRDPGEEYKEDFTTGSTAAIAGGVTTVVDMPNTGTLVVSPEDVKTKLKHIEGRSHADYGIYALLRDSAPFIEELVALGVAGLKWLLGYDTLLGRPVRPSDNVHLKETLERAADHGLLVGVHAESHAWLRDLGAAAQAEGRNDPTAHEGSRPPFVEAIGVAEACLAAAAYGCRLHIHHLSSEWGLKTALAVEELSGLDLTIETCPHYLLLDLDDVRELGSVARVNPPIHAKGNADALWQGVLNGTIDCVATDHAPHRPEEKRSDDIWAAQSGFVGVETLVPLMYHEVAEGRLSLGRFVEVLSENPARIVGIDHRKGFLQPGLDADVVLLDPSGVTEISEDRLHSKNSVTPFEGWKTNGRIAEVYLRGQRVFSEGKVIGAPAGEFLPSDHRRAR